MKPEKLINDFAICIALLKRREREANIARADGALANDYFSPDFDNDALAQEFRQLSKAYNAMKPGGGTDEDPTDPPQSARKKKRNEQDEH